MISLCRSIGMGCVLLVAGFGVTPSSMAGGCWGDFSAEVWAATSDAAFVGELLTQYATRDAVTGEIWTHSVVRVDEALKGQLPSMLEVRQPGGTVGSVAQYDSSFQDLTGLVGELAVFMVKERGGELELAQGLGALPTASVSVTSELRAALAMAHPGGRDLRAFGVDYRFTKDVTDNGLLGGSIDPSRFTVQDRGLPIGVVVDARVLPPGISVQQAMGALGNALAAWEAVTSIRFQILGTEEFAVPPNQLNRSDQRIYVQMGDPYGAIDNEDSTLGRGGRSTTGIFTVSTNPPENLQGLGGTVNGVGFDRSEYGYVILDHEKEALQVLSDFEEVLTHEIGHALGLAHSSEDPNESNETLKAAMMYYRVEGSGRGARLEAYDAEKVQQAYPVGNTPPFGLDRDLLQLAAPVDFLLPGVNEVQLTAGDLQGDPLTVSILEVRENTAAFSLVGDNTLRFASLGNYGDGDAPEGQFFNLARLQFSDGTNLSPIVSIRVTRIRNDANGDGMPESWVNQYFDGTAPNPDADADEDGLTNFQELKWGLNPTEADALTADFGLGDESVTFMATAGIPYVLERSENLVEWSPWNFVTPESTGTAELSLSGAPEARSFFRLLPVE